jgi:CRISP-associated protein Cas1
MSTEPLPSRPAFPSRPIAAKAGLSRAIALPQYLPARMLNEFVYCPRLFFYEWVEGVFAHSGDTVAGALRHETLGEKGEALTPAANAGEERIHSRSVSLSSELHGLIAVIDLVEGEGGHVSPVDYKHGAPREEDGTIQAWPTDRVQVCVQALILREHGYTCDEAVVYYNRTKQDAVPEPQPRFRQFPPTIVGGPIEADTHPTAPA